VSKELILMFFIVVALGLALLAIAANTDVSVATDGITPVIP